MPYDDRMDAGKSCVAIFWVLALCYVAYIWARQFHWQASGEMWAEAATTYFFKAQSTNLWDRFFSTEAGYLPLVGRIIAAVTRIFKAPLPVVPYIYNVSAIFLTGLSVATFALPVFRRVIASDGLRVLICLACFLLNDFETVTFINFTYCGLVPCIGLILVAMRSDDTDYPPWWAWLLPLFIVSKPYYLALVPALLLAFILAGQRYRWLLGTWLLALAAQATQMLISLSQGEMAYHRAPDLSFLDKIIVAITSFLGFIGGFPLGRVWATGLNETSPYTLIVLGTALTAGLIFLLLKSRHPAKTLIAAGLSIIGMTFLINAFTLSTSWNYDYFYFKHFHIYRHVLSALWSGIFVMAGLFWLFSERFSRRQNVIAYTGFILWMLISGWFWQGIKAAAFPDFPITHGSYWQQSVMHLGEKLSPLCIPVDPFPWRVERDCALISPPPGQIPGQVVPLANSPFVKYDGLVLRDKGIELPIPQNLKGTQVTGIGLVAKPRAGAMQGPVRMTIVVKTADSQTKEFTGQHELHPAGTLLFSLGSVGNHIAENVVSARVYIDSSVDIAAKDSDKGLVPDVLWYGKNNSSPNCVRYVTC